ncbi:MAG: hypothetical protein GY759_10435 [Chloroflexi bacterium]|nr:hypothetical protein [Chloroflexota bacterium]
MASYTKNPWLKAQSASGWALSPSGARLLANQVLRGRALMEVQKIDR